MTLEELQVSQEQIKKELEALKEEKETLEKNQKEQNSYITKIESELKAYKEKEKPTPQNPAPQPSATNLDSHSKVVLEYAGKRFMQDVVDEASQGIILQVGQEVYEALKKDFKEFLDKNLTIDKADVKYILQSFNLVYGRAMTNKEHPIHQVFNKDPKKQTPPPGQVTQQRVGVMTNEDKQAGILGNPNPNANPDKPKSTREAWNMRFGGGK
jgi:hypothetical protein